MSLQVFSNRVSPLKTVLLLICCLILCALLWLAWVSRPLNVAREFGIEPPPPATVPSPNAADLYVTANMKFGELRRTGKAVARILDSRARTNEDNDAQLYPLAGKVGWVGQNKVAFALLDQATATPYYSAPVRSENTKGYLTPHATLRQLARYDTVRCEALNGQEQYQQAVDKSLNMWKAGLTVQTNAALIPTLTGIAIETMARKALDPNLAHLTAAQAALAAKRLEAMVPMRPSLKTLLQEEYISHLYNIRPQLENHIRYEAREKKQAAEFEGKDYIHVDMSPIEEQRSWLLLTPIFNWSARKMAHEFHIGMQPLLRQANLSWSQRHLQSSSGLSSEVNYLIITLGKSRFFHSKAEVGQQMTMARLALHAYRKAKGTYPATLNELAPTYLNKVPSDAFADGKSLNYRRDGQRYRLWSVGPDGRNDNAKPGINSTAIPESQLLIAIESQGDIVANINRY